MKQLVLIFCIVLLTACQNLDINKKYQAVGQDSRVQFIIVHYTAADLKRSLYLLTTQPVSSHYLIDSSSGQIYQLVNENQRAWHAGVSEWQGKTYLNASTIGIELVSPGFTETEQGRVWIPYTEQQIDSLITLLKDIQTRYKLPAENILGHSDIAPQRKTDPGPLFPWRRLAQEGLAVWPDEQAVSSHQIFFDNKGLPSIAWMQQKLSTIGYAVPLTGKLDNETKRVISAFQMRYQPEQFDGTPNSKTAALLLVVSEKKFALPH